MKLPITTAPSLTLPACSCAQPRFGHLCMQLRFKSMARSCTCCFKQKPVSVHVTTRGVPHQTMPPFQKPFGPSLQVRGQTHSTCPNILCVTSRHTSRFNLASSFQHKAAAGQRRLIWLPRASSVRQSPQPQRVAPEVPLVPPPHLRVYHTTRSSTCHAPALPTCESPTTRRAPGLPLVTATDGLWEATRPSAPPRPLVPPAAARDLAQTCWPTLPRIAPLMLQLLADGNPPSRASHCERPRWSGLVL